MKLFCPNFMIIALAEMNLWYIFKVMWLWRDEIIIDCLISLIWVNFSRCTYLPTLLVVGLMEIDISVLISILTWIRQSAILRDFQNQEYQYPGKAEWKEFKQLQSDMLYK